MLSLYGKLYVQDIDADGEWAREYKTRRPQRIHEKEICKERTRMVSPRPVTADDIKRILSGDVKHMQILADQRLNDVAQVAETMSPQERTLTAEAVKRVLMALSAGKNTPEEMQAWTSFVKRGYFPTREKRFKTIEFLRQEDREGAIVEALFRMDELGDLIDGTMDDDEIRQHIEQLGS